MKRIISLLTTLAGAAALAACDGSATSAAPSELSRADAEALAPAFGEMADSEVGGLGAPSFAAAGESGIRLAVTTTTDFTRTRGCPQGGSVTLRGTVVVTADRETRTASQQYNAVRTDSACAFPLRDGVMTINGNPNTVVAGSWSIANGVPGVRTLTHRGAFTWAHSSGRTGSCTVDLTTTWTPATQTRRVQGTVCNRTVDVTRTRS